MTTETTGEALLDTSVVVRYLTNDPPELAVRAAQIIECDELRILSELVVIESAYVLTSVYAVPRDSVVDALQALVQRRNLRPLALSKAHLLEALSHCRGSHRVSFVDALLWAQAREAGPGRIYTFDQRFPERGVELLT